MQIAVSGHQLAAGEAFRDYATAELQALCEKYFKRALSAQVTLAPGPHGAGFVCEAMMHVTGNVILKGRRQGGARAARIGYRARQDRQTAPPTRPPPARARGNGRRGARCDGRGLYRIRRPARGGGSHRPEPGPLVIAESAVDVPSASVSDAVWMLDLRNTTALLFRNVNTDALNMVYRRDDGNIGWVEPGKRGANGT